MCSSLSLAVGPTPSRSSPAGAHSLTKAIPPRASQKAARVTGRREGALSLKVFLDMCREDGVEPRKTFSGKFNLRIPAQLHERIASVAAAEGKSLNQWVAEALEREAMA